MRQWVNMASPGYGETWWTWESLWWLCLGVTPTLVSPPSSWPISVAAITKSVTTKQPTVTQHAILEASSPKSASMGWNEEVSRVTVSLKALGEDLPFPLPASGGSKHSLAWVCIILTLVSIFTLAFLLCLHLSCFSYGCLSLDLGSTWVIQDDLILRSLISYVCKDSFSREGHIHRFWNISFLGEPPTSGSLLFTVSAPHFLPLSRPSLHPVTQNGSPLCFWNSWACFFTHWPLCWALFSPRILREPLSPPRVFALLSLSHRSFPWTWCLVMRCHSQRQPPAQPRAQPLPSSPLALLVFRKGLLSAGHPLSVCHLSVSLMRMAFTRGGTFVCFVHCCSLRF